jgi:hypothetical protein
MKFPKSFKNQAQGSIRIRKPSKIKSSKRETQFLKRSSSKRISNAHSSQRSTKNHS